MATLIVSDGRLVDILPPLDQLTCDYHDDHDEDGRPRGNRCGKPVTHEIKWKDGRWSMACDEHAADFRREVPELVRSIDPLPVAR
jgi:hypothetical protein